MVNYLTLLTIIYSNWPQDLEYKENIGEYLYDLRMRKASLSRKAKGQIIKSLKHVQFHRKVQNLSGFSREGGH